MAWRKPKMSEDTARLFEAGIRARGRARRWGMGTSHWQGRVTEALDAHDTLAIEEMKARGEWPE